MEKVFHETIDQTYGEKRDDSLPHRCDKLLTPYAGCEKAKCRQESHESGEDGKDEKRDGKLLGLRFGLGDASAMISFLA